MCLILLAWQMHPDWPLVVAANRDEFHARPSAAAAPWPDAPHIVAGRDLQAGGTWLGVNQNRHFAAVTNYRQANAGPGNLSRGALTRNFLLADVPAADYIRQIDDTAYAGYNLLVADRQTGLWYRSNRRPPGRPEVQALPPGVHGVSNHLLNTPWPKLSLARGTLAELVNAWKKAPDIAAKPDLGRVFDLLRDDRIVADPQLPQTGVSLAWERRLSAIFVQSADYGTRASTIFLQHRSGAGLLVERLFAADGRITGESCWPLPG